MKFEKLAHGWWVDNGCFGNLRGYQMHPKIHSIGSLLHVLTNLYYKVRLSVFHVPLLENYKKVFQVLLDHGADPNNQLMYPFVDEHQLEKMYSDITGQALLHSAVAQFDIEDVKIFLKTVLMRISNMRAVCLSLTRSTFRERQSTCILQKSHGLRKKTNWATSASSERVSSICHLRAAQID